MLFNVLVASFGVCLLLYCIWLVGCVGYWFGWLLAGFVWCYLRFLGLGGCYDLLACDFRVCGWLLCGLWAIVWIWILVAVSFCTCLVLWFLCVFVAD